MNWNAWKILLWLICRPHNKGQAYYLNLQEISKRDSPPNMMFLASYKENILLCLIDLLANTVSRFTMKNENNSDS